MKASLILRNNDRIGLSRRYIDARNGCAENDSSRGWVRQMDRNPAVAEGAEEEIGDQAAAGNINYHGKRKRVDT